MKLTRAFTLIELLIVVAIIAILAAIAVPNFLEAQTRAKVARIVNDFRTMKTALETYRIDNNIYPETDLGGTQISTQGFGVYRLTTPISYLTSIAKSPFDEFKIGFGAVKPHAVEEQIPLYVRARYYRNADAGSINFGGEDYDRNYCFDRLGYLAQLNLASIPPGLIGFATKGEYLIKSVGPDGVDDRDVQGAPTAFARVYDPTNGTVSGGDIVTWQDTDLPASPRQP